MPKRVPAGGLDFNSKEAARQHCRGIPRGGELGSEIEREHWPLLEALLYAREEKVAELKGRKAGPLPAQEARMAHAVLLRRARRRRTPRLQLREVDRSSGEAEGSRLGRRHLDRPNDRALLLRVDRDPLPNVVMDGDLVEECQKEAPRPAPPLLPR